MTMTRKDLIQVILILVLTCFLLCLRVNSVCADNCPSTKSVEPDEEITLVQETLPLKVENIETIKYNETKQSLELIPQYETLEVKYISSAKTYMDYKAITCKISTQWDMIHNQKLFNFTEDGFLITDDGFYAVALGSYFGTLGNKYIMITDEGNEIPVIMTDMKQDIHTDSNNFAGSIANDVIEFIVDSSKMPKWDNGYCYGGNFNNIEQFKGNVVEIRVVND